MTEHGLGNNYDENKRKVLENALEQTRLSERQQEALRRGGDKLFSIPPAKTYKSTLSFDEDFYNVSRAYATGHDVTYSQFFQMVVRDFFQRYNIDMRNDAYEIRNFYYLESLLRKWYKGNSMTVNRSRIIKNVDFNDPFFQKEIGATNLTEVTAIAFNLREQIQKLPDRISREAAEELGTDFSEMKETMLNNINNIIVSLHDEYHSPFFEEIIEENNEEEREDSF